MEDNNSHHSSPASRRSLSPRPLPERQRSNSLPIVEALGCSAAEAKILLAEGQAAVRTRHARHRRDMYGQDQRSQRPQSSNSHKRQNIAVMNPHDHLYFLNSEAPVADGADEAGDDALAPRRPALHTRMPSNQTTHSFNSNSTITGPAKSPGLPPLSPRSPPGSPLGDYSANLAKFIKSQLNSIPAYHAKQPFSPSSCPDLSPRRETSPESPAMPVRRPVQMPHIIEIPPVRPPLRSQFSEWSTTDDETDNEESLDNLPPLPVIEPSRKDSMTGEYTPSSILGYYEKPTPDWISFSSTPDEPAEPEADYPFAPDFQFPPIPRAQIPRSMPGETVSPAFRLPEVSADYFESERPGKLKSGLRERIVSAVTPMENFSPLESADGPPMHSAVPRSQRITVEGMAFDMIQAR